MPIADIGDPRLQALFGRDEAKAGVQPMVRLPRRGLSSVSIAVGAVLLGLLLFAILNGRRTTQADPPNNLPRAGTAPIQFEPPPPLYIPPAPAPVTVPAVVGPKQPAVAPFSIPPVTQRIVQPEVIYSPPSMPQSAPLPAPPPPARTSAGSALVIDSGTGPVATPGATSGTNLAIGQAGQTVTRMRASAFANRSMTVPQGFLIPAVLETGFDSTKPGFARAIVSRDVRGFDGKNVLIPRGSRLIGEYGSDVAQSQKRVAIIWTRLLRPDGMTIAMDSPAVDTVGRGGVAASVNTHFFQRLGDALLQSSFEIGRVLAGRKIDDTVIVVSGNATTAAAQIMPTTTYVPTLKVPAGKSISIFVAHDLDFSTAGINR